MNCQDLRFYLKDPLGVDADIRAQAEHLAHCAECASFAEAQRELAAGVRLIRESVPQISASLDTAVLAEYRRHIAARSSVVSFAPVRRHLAILCWSAAAAAAVMLVAFLIFPGRKPVTTATRPRPAGPAIVSEPVITSKTADVSRPPTPKASRVVRPQRSLPPVSAVPVAAFQRSLPPGFRSLMYCDELICGGTMDVIRVQMPSSDVAFGPFSGSANGTVYADVLVGPDGIARGIRIDE
jgi:hypothetical protein